MTSDDNFNFFSENQLTKFKPPPPTTLFLASREDFCDAFCVARGAFGVTTLVAYKSRAPPQGAVQCQLRFDARVCDTDKARYGQSRAGSSAFTAFGATSTAPLSVCFVSSVVSDKLSPFRARAEGKIKLYINYVPRSFPLTLLYGRTDNRGHTSGRSKHGPLLEML